MYDLMGAIVSVWLVTVTVEFVEIDQHYSTYNQTLTFRSEQHCETVLKQVEHNSIIPRVAHAKSSCDDAQNETAAGDY